jgi:hypothetical protein
LLCRGNRQLATKSIFNACALHFGTRLFKKKSNQVLNGAACDEDIASAMYQPNTTQTLLKTLLRVFSRQSIPYSLT